MSQSAQRKSSYTLSTTWPRVLIIGGIALLVIAILTLKGEVSAEPRAALLPAEQLQQALADARPTMVFFHSLDCDPCVQMMGVVDGVYPSFSETVVLVDVNVSDTRNHDLLRAEGIRAIPSLVFYSRGGRRSETFYGVMPPEQLEQALQSLVEQPS
ncbi:MAG: hypothetical protein Kow00124_12450 [Anaerolineae bacterium]